MKSTRETCHPPPLANRRASPREPTGRSRGCRRHLSPYLSLNEHPPSESISRKPQLQVIVLGSAATRCFLSEVVSHSEQTGRMRTRGRRCLAADEKKKKVAHRRGASQRQRQAFGKTRRTGSSAMLRLLRPRPEAQWLVRRARREALLGSGPLRPPGAGPLEGALDDVLVPSRGSSPGKGEHFSTEML